MLTHEQRILANRLADLIVATNRWYAIKRQLRDQRAARMKRTKKREPHVGNKAPILIAHAHEESRCIDRLADALKVSRRDLRAIQAAVRTRQATVGGSGVLRGTTLMMTGGVVGCRRSLSRKSQSSRCGCVCLEILGVRTKNRTISICF